MVIAHFSSAAYPTNPIEVFLGTVHGRASLAFVFVAGLGVTLLDRAKGPRESGLTLLWRAVVLVPMGIVLQEVSPGPVLILQFYAVYYLVGWLGARLPTLALAAVIPIWTVIGCALWWQEAPPLAISEVAFSPGEQLALILYYGQYPVVTWGPMVLLGVLIARFDLRDRTVQLTMLGASVAVLTVVHLSLYMVEAAGIVIPPWAILEHHSNSITYLVDGYAAAVLVVALCLIFGSRLGIVGRWLAIAGRQALTLYVVHMIWFVLLNGTIDELYVMSPAVDFTVDPAEFAWWDQLFNSLNYVAAGVCFGLLVLQAVLWDRFFGLGPLERILRRPSVFRA